MNKNIFPAIILCGVLFSGGCFWQDKSPVAGDPSAPRQENQSPAVDPAAEWRKLDLTLYPNADTVLLRDQESVTCNSDGTSLRQDESWTLIKTAAGRDEYKTVTLHFNEFYQQIPELDVEIIKPDGRKVKVELQKKISVESSQMDANIYDPANKVLTAGIPGLEVGDILYVKYRSRTIRPRMQGIWCDISLLQSNMPILEYNYTISVPEDFPLRSIAVKDEVKGTLRRSEKREGSRIIYQFEARNVPQVVPEPDMPPWYLHCMRVLTSTAKDWQEISRWYHQLCEKRLAATSVELTAMAEKITAGKSGRTAIRALFDYVSKEIRYTGVTNEDTAPGYEPHDVKDTFAQKHGVCRDKAALLAAMLREAGFDAFMVLFMAGDPKDPEIPNNYFNHAITGVKLPDGELILMDPTDENSVDMLPAYAMDKSFLCATADGDTLRRTGVTEAGKNMLKISTQGKLDDDYTLHLQSELTFEGINDNIYRGAFAQWSRDYRQEFVSSVLKKALPGAELECLEVFPADVRNLSETFKLKLKYSIRNFTEVQWGVAPMKMPFINQNFGALSFMLKDDLMQVRRYPMSFFSTAGVSEEFSIALPENLQLMALPENRTVEQGALSASVQVTCREKGVLHGRKEIKLNKLEIPADEYSEFYRAIQELKLSNCNNNAIIRPRISGVTTAVDKVNAIKEKETVKLEYSSLDKCVIRFDVELKVLNYGGVKEYSELHLPFVQGLSMAEFLGGSVTSADGKVFKVDPAQIKVMDDPVSVAAPRYPAAKRLIVPMPGVAPGSTVKYSWQLKMHNAAYRDRWLVMPENIPVRNKIVEISYPAGLRKKIKTLLPQSAFAVEQKTSGGRIIHRIVGSNLQAVPTEIAAPAHWLFLPAAAVANFDLAEYSARVKKALQKASADAPECRRLALELTADCTSDSEKAERIRNYVARNIRRAGLELDVLGPEQITPADVTLRENYGNSADHAVVLHAMLEAAGIKSRFYLASDLPVIAEVMNKFNMLPRNVFGNVLLEVESAERSFMLNGSDEYSVLGSCRFESKLGIDLDAGEIKLISCEPEYQSAIRREWQIKCLDDKSAEIVSTTFYYGMEYAAVKRFFDRITPEKERQYWATVTSGVLSGGKISDIKKDLASYPGEISFRIKVPGFWRNSGEYASVELPESSAEKIIRTAGKRTLPYWSSKVLDHQESYTVDVPDSWQSCEFSGGNFALSMPANDVVAEMKSSWDSDRILRVQEKVTAWPFYFDSSASGMLENIQKQLSSPGNRTFLFKTTGK